MVVVTMKENGQLEIPKGVRERLGMHPGAQLALSEGNNEGVLHLRVLPEAAQLVEKEGVWVIRAQEPALQETEKDWIAEAREERIASLMEKRFSE